MNTEMISLDKINEDESIQIREEIDLSLVDTYRILMRAMGRWRCSTCSRSESRYLSSTGFTASRPPENWAGRKSNVRFTKAVGAMPCSLLPELMLVTDNRSEGQRKLEPWRRCSKTRSGFNGRTPESDGIAG